MGRHRLERVRPRYGRMLSAACALAVTLVAVAGGVGGLGGTTGGPGGAMPVASAGLAVAAELAPDNANAGNADATEADAGANAATAAAEAEPDARQEQRQAQRKQATAERSEEPVARSSRPAALPADSGQGRRVVFSESAQRVWLVEQGGEVQRTYLVSGSVYDNLDPGTYSVYSRSEQAWGIDNSGTMKYFVRFTRGENAAIGFHDIPELDGSPVQTLDELGTPLSHGCIRQKREDAIALWEFAPLGTTVVVTP